ncbi:meprin A subunit beta-like [Macrosteles quadrilineatus]|uniref:meprin A subunit beta-like n=1 Tax=Macrosteles quadrilineatus TaxID=74068 RepID=UPI0023E2505B|nr:meprin A subunit beta-like [Macrosteles quadrilineatus]
MGRNAVSNPNLLWPSAAIIYKTSDDVGCPDSPQCEILMRAMNHYHARSCIRFKEWTGEPNYVDIFFNSDSGACWSPVGRTGNGVQRLSLGQRCWYLGIVVHELGHAIGFWHEMNRPDRDDWIYVYWKNIIQGFSSSFAKHDARTVDSLGERFDYRSIMMYDEYAFSKDGISPTLQAKTGEEIGPIWKKRGLSASDIRRVHKLYKCNGNKQKLSFPYDISCDFNQHTCGFKNGGSAVWNWRTVNATDGYVYSSYDQAGVTPGYFMSINLHAISDKDTTRGPLGCVRFWYLLQGDGNASLKLLHAYLDKVTQLTYDNEKTFDLWLNDTVANEWVHVDVPIYITRPFKLIFYSQFEDGATYGTIALDDIEIMYSACPEDSASVSVPVSSSSSPPAITETLTPTTTTEDPDLSEFTESAELVTTPEDIDETVEESNSIDESVKKQKKN